MKKDEATTIKAWSGIRAENYGKLIRETTTSEDQFWAGEILRRAPEKDVLRVLDVGTGPGYFTILLSKLGHDVTGIDVTPDMISVAKKNSEGLNLDFRVMNADELSFEDNTFDLIVSRVVTWTIPNMIDCYREWRRVLAPGGRILVFDSNFRSRFFDPAEERRIREIARKEAAGCEGVYTGFVGYHIREAYWEGRPMIGTPRPEWDRNALIKLRFKDITIDEQIYREPDPRQRICPVFAITATKPSPEEEADLLIEEHWDGMGACCGAYASAAIETGRSDEYVESIGSHIAGTDILDVGCGCGLVSVALAKRGYRVTGVDCSSVMLEEADRCASENGCEVAFTKANAYLLPFPDSSFDTVVCRNSFWFFRDPGKVLKEMHRVLRTGGSLVITDNEWMNDLDAAGARYVHHNTGELGSIRVNLGYAGYEIIDDVLFRLPQNKGDYAGYLRDALSGLFSETEVTGGYRDPAVHPKLRDLVKHPFIATAKK